MVASLEATQCSKLSLHASELDADICQAIKRISAHILNVVDINIPFHQMIFWLPFPAAWIYSADVDLGVRLPTFHGSHHCNTK